MALTQSDNALLRAWRVGELDAKAAEAFEMRLFFEPELAEAAQLDQRLAAGMAPVAASKVAAPSPAAAPARVGRSQHGPWSMLLAAGLGALAVLPFAMNGDSTPAALGNIDYVSVDVRRGASSEFLLVEPRAAAGLVVLELPAPDMDRGPYSVSLVSATDGQSMLSLPNLQPTDGLLNFGFVRDALPAGDYRIEVAAAGGQVVDGSLQIRYRPAVTAGH